MGENDYDLKQFLKKWIHSSVDKYGEYNVVRYDFQDKPVSELLGELNAPPFFGDGKRIFFIDNFPPSPPSRPFSDKKKKEILALAEALLTLSDDTVVVLAVPKPDKRISAFKKISAVVGKTYTFPAWSKEYSGALSSEGLSTATEWVMEQVSLLQGEILPAAARFMVQYCGADPWVLSNEVEKLVTYFRSSKKPISENDIKHLSSPSDEMINFAFSNAMQTGKSSEVLDIIDKLFATGEAPQAILNRDLLPTIRQLLQVRFAIDSGASAKEAGVHPFVFGKLKRIAEKFDSKKLLEAHAHLKKIDIDSKTGLLPLAPDKTSLFRLEVEKIVLQLFGLV